MKDKIVVLFLAISLVALALSLMIPARVGAVPTGPTLTVNDALNQIHATLDANLGSIVTVKGTVTNLAAPPPGPGGWLTGVLYKEIGGTGIIPADLNILWSLDEINWWPAGPIWSPTLYPGYDLELIIGAGGYYIPIGLSSTTFIKATTTRNINPTDIQVIVFADINSNSKYDLGEPIQTTGNSPVKIDLTIWHTAELDPTIFFYTIQAAINAATPGDTIYVYPGIYVETLTINKALTLTGDPGDNSPGPGANAPILDGTGLGSNIGAVSIAQGVTDVIFEGFEIRNYGTPTPTAPYNTNADGISVWNSGTFNIQIRDNYVHHVGYDGILVGNGWGGLQGLHSGWVIARNIIENFGAYAIDLENTKDSQITNNVISNPTYTTTYGVVVLALACDTNTIDMSGVTVSGNQFSNYPDRALNLMAWAPDAGAAATLRNVAVTGNTITGSFNSIIAWKAGPGTVTIRDLTFTSNSMTLNNPKAANYIADLSDVSGTNTFSHNALTLTGIIGSGGTFFHGVNIGGSATGSWTIEHNKLDGNNIGAGSCGFRIRSTLPPTAALKMTCNCVTEWARGIRSDALASGAQFEAHCNNFFGNTEYGVSNGAGALIDAEDNWWGSAKGPTHASNPEGTGDAVSDYVDFDPWLKWEACGQPPVGGEWVPTALVSILTPPIGLISLLTAAVAACFIYVRRKMRQV